GVLGAGEVVGQPISTVLSGPAAGALGAALLARRAGFVKVLTCDGGGPWGDASGGIWRGSRGTREGSFCGCPGQVSMSDGRAGGGGGGPMAWLSPGGALKVGPESAGADQGPLCYGHGGTDVTVTDAHLLLGRIPPHLLGGEIPLDVDAAREGLGTLAGKL